MSDSSANGLFRGSRTLGDQPLFLPAAPVTHTVGDYYHANRQRN